MLGAVLQCHQVAGVVFQPDLATVYSYHNKFISAWAQQFTWLSQKNMPKYLFLNFITYFKEKEHLC